ncbi:MAG: Fis family transcriptional regulator [Arcobacter sp.]|nr:MAG: Fis family transcriptional regulator [Arcobacter sp.]
MQEFIARSNIMKEIKNSANLLKHLDINVLIKGSSGVGKKSLARYINENANFYTAKVLQKDIQDKVLDLANTCIIIENIEDISNSDLFLSWVEENNIRIIACTTKDNLSLKIADIFSLSLEIPNLDKRKEDIKPLATAFSKEASIILGQESKPNKLIINTSDNAHSLRKSIFLSHLFESIGENEIMMLIEKYVLDNMQGENAYKDFLYLFEAPLLKAAQKKHKSQVQMAKHLGLNRITLRKKLEIHKELL